MQQKNYAPADHGGGPGAAGGEKEARLLRRRRNSRRREWMEKTGQAQRTQRSIEEVPRFCQSA